MNRNNKGSVLAIVFLVLVSLGVLGVAVTLRSVNESGVARRQLYSNQAFWLADAGVHRAVWEIKSNSCAGFKNETTNAVCASCSSCGAGNIVAAAVVGGGEYEAVLNAGRTTLTSTGYFPSKAAEKAHRSLRVTLTGTMLFQYAAFARGKMTFSNNAVVDSFNSNNGDYGGSNVGAHGNIGTNSAEAGAITLDNNVIINGSASTASGGTVIQSNGSTVTGGVTNANNVVLAPIVVPTDLASSTALGVLTFGNSEIKTFAAGNYKYSSVSYNNNVKFIVDGNVQLYLTGNPAFTGGNNAQVIINEGASLMIYAEGVVNFDNNVLLNNLSKDPSKFIIFSKYAGSNGVNVSNNGTFYGAVYSPDTDINFNNNANLYGAMVGKTVDVSNNDRVHYDEALGTFSVGEKTNPLDWQEL